MPEKQENRQAKGNLFLPLLSSLANKTIIGSMAGASETLVNHPFYSLKTRLQCGYPFTLNPLILYRGLGASLSFMVPIISTRISINDSIQYLTVKDQDKNQSVKKIFAAFCSGIASTLITNPSELVIVYQQKYGGTFLYGMRNVRLNPVLSFPLLGGFFGSAMRDGIFTSAFLAGTPVLKQKIKYMFSSEYSLSLVAGSTVGVLSALVSQPFDTVKTLQHDSIASGKYLTAAKVFDLLYKKDGIYGLYKGGGFRCARVVSSVTILSFATEKLRDNLRLIP
jgi:solute carrier family 25 citrate transporter 1